MDHNSSELLNLSSAVSTHSLTCAPHTPLDLLTTPLVTHSLIYSKDSTIVGSCSVTQLCPTLCNPMGCSSPGSPVHGIFQARVLEWIVISFSMGSSWSMDWTLVSSLAGGFLTTSTTWEALQQSSSMFTCFKFLAFKVRFYFSSLPQPPKKFENLWCDLSLRNLSGPKGPVKCWLSLQWRLGKSRIDLDSFSFSAIILKCRSLFKAVIVQISWG